MIIKTHNYGPHVAFDSMKHGTKVCILEIRISIGRGYVLPQINLIAIRPRLHLSFQICICINQNYRAFLHVAVSLKIKSVMCICQYIT